MKAKKAPQPILGRGAFKRPSFENETSAGKKSKLSQSESSNLLLDGSKGKAVRLSHTEQQGKGTLIEFNEEERQGISSKLSSTFADLGVNHRYQNLRFTGRLNFAAGYNLEVSGFSTTPRTESKCELY